MVDLDNMDEGKMQVISGGKGEEKEEEMIDLDNLSDDDNMFATPATANNQ